MAKFLAVFKDCNQGVRVQHQFDKCCLACAVQKTSELLAEANAMHRAHTAAHGIEYVQGIFSVEINEL